MSKEKAKKYKERSPSKTAFIKACNRVCVDFLKKWRFECPKFVKIVDKVHHFKDYDTACNMICNGGCYIKNVEPIDESEIGNYETCKNCEKLVGDIKTKVYTLEHNSSKYHCGYDNSVKMFCGKSIPGMPIVSKTRMEYPFDYCPICKKIEEMKDERNS